LAKTADLLVKIGADISDFQNKFDELRSGIKKTGDSLSKTGKKLTTKVTAPIVALGTGAVTTAANFEKSMNKVSAMSGATGDELQALEDQAKYLGATTLHSASDAADGMSFLAMAGFEVSEIMESMPAMLSLATAGELDLAAAADIASNIISGFGMEASQAGAMADVLALAASSSNTSVEQLGHAMSFVAPVAKGAGISLEETAGAIGMMSDAGIQGGRAGTTLRRIISSLQNPTGATADAIEEMGLSMEDLNPTTNSLAEILGKLEEAGMTSAQAIQLVGDVGGPGLIAMMEQGEEGLSKLTNSLESSEGSAEQMADTMSGGMYGAFKELLSILEAVAIEFGEVLAPAVHGVIDVLKSLLQWFNSLSNRTKTIIAIIAAVVAAIGPLLMIVGFIMTALAGVSLAMIKVVAIVAVVIAVIGALVAAFVHAWNTSEEFQEVVLAVWEAIKQTFIAVVDIIKQVLSGLWEFILEIFGLFMEYWNEYGEQLIEKVMGIFQTIYETIATVLGIIWEYIQTVLDVLRDLWDEHGDTLMTLIDSVFGAIWETIMAIVDRIQEFIEMALEKITEFWDKHGEQLMTIVRVAMTFIGDFIAKIMEYLQFVFDIVWPYLKDVVSNVWDTIIGVISGAWDIISGIVGFFINILTGDFAGAWESVQDIVIGIWDVIVSTIKGAINGIISGINGFIRGINKISFDIPNWVPVIGGKKFEINIPLIPKRATGGIASGSTLAEIGEGAHPEMVAPLNDATMKPFANLIAKHLPQDRNQVVFANQKDPLANRPIILVSPEGRILAEFVADDVKEINDRNQRIIADF